MELVHFHTLRLGVQSNASPAAGEELTAMAAAFADMLHSSELFDSVEVDVTDDPDRLVIGLSQFRADLPEQEVADTIGRLWDERVRYPFWEAHALVVEPDHVEFEAATRAGPASRYVTVHMVAQKTRIPVQRQPLPEHATVEKATVDG